MVICDGCGTDQHVRRAFVIVWNGNIVDLCRDCYSPLIEILDRYQGFTTASGSHMKRRTQ